MGLFSKLTHKEDTTELTELVNKLAAIYFGWTDLRSRSKDYPFRIQIGNNFINFSKELDRFSNQSINKVVLSQCTKGTYYYNHPKFKYLNGPKGSEMILEQKVEEVLKGIRSDEYTYAQNQKFVDRVSSVPQVAIELNNETVLSKNSVADMPEIKIQSVGKSFNKDQKLSAYVVIDLETTGLKASVNKIIQLSAVRIIEDSPVEVFTTYLNPKTSITDEITKINGITNEMVQDAPTLNQVTEAFLMFVGSSPIVGYNVSFDLKFLYAAGIDLITKRKIYDAYALAKKAYKEDLETFSLEDVTDNLRICYPAHNSLYDCFATFDVFRDEIDVITE